jgi:hypothetical protein
VAANHRTAGFKRTSAPPVVAPTSRNWSGREREWQLLAHRIVSPPYSNPVAFGTDIDSLLANTA